MSGAAGRGPNPFLARLGFGPRDRVVIVHADDVGMCPATVAAFAELVEAAAVSSASLMVPCPGFAEAAAFCRDHPEVDAGVHLTLTSEWESCRWGPLSAAPEGGLVDAAGFFHRDREAAGERADPGAAEREMASQLDRAEAAGVDVTHVDSHMFAALQPRLLPGYLRLARRRRLPALVWWPGGPGYRLSEGEELLPSLAAWDEAGLPVLDAVAPLSLGWRGDRWELAKPVLDALPAGLTHLILHPARDEPELRAIASDWPARVADFELFRSGRPARHLKRLGVHVIGYRPLREAIRARPGPESPA